MNSHFQYKNNYDVYITQHGIMIYCSLLGIAGSDPAASMDLGLTSCPRILGFPTKILESRHIWYTKPNNVERVATAWTAGYRISVEA
jgi:hypothetical protein